MQFLLARSSEWSLPGGGRDGEQFRRVRDRLRSEVNRECGNIIDSGTDYLLYGFSFYLGSLDLAIGMFVTTCLFVSVWVAAPWSQSAPSYERIGNQCLRWSGRMARAAWS